MDLNATTKVKACPNSEVLQKFLENSLDGETFADIEDHLAGCATCKNTVEHLIGQLPGPLTPAFSASSQDTAPPELPGYRTGEKIAAGGMGEVWQVSDLQFNRSLAVKVIRSNGRLHPGLAKRFKAEAQIMGQLAHPFIVPVHDMGTLGDGRPYYTMKLVEGKTLAETLDERTDLKEGMMGLISIFGQICQAVAYAHDRQVVHRDLKPQNIMVGQHGEVQVMDWGLAKVLPNAGPSGQDDLDDAEQVATVMGEAPATQGRLGTPAYMPPEQASGDLAHVGPSSDVFGLGTILCQILTGAPPYTGDDVLSKAEDADLSEAWARLDACDCDPELVRLARQCLAPDAADRPADADEVAEQVESYITGVQQRAEEDRVARVRQEAKATGERKLRILWMGLALCLAALLCAAWPALAEGVKDRNVDSWTSAVKTKHESLLQVDQQKRSDHTYVVTLEPKVAQNAKLASAALDKTLDEALAKAGIVNWISGGLVNQVSGISIPGFELDTVPSQVFDFRNLQSLDLSTNELTQLPTKICDLTELTQLHIPRNKLEKLPRQIGQLEKLQSLHLTNNPIADLPTGICTLPNLEKLYVENAKLTTLPDEIGELQSLTVLRLTGNDQLKLPTSLTKLANLKELNLSQQVIDSHPDIVRELRKNGTKVEERRGGGRRRGGGDGKGSGSGGTNGRTVEHPRGGHGNSSGKSNAPKHQTHL